jgi:hypothetical protein
MNLLVPPGINVSPALINGIAPNLAAVPPYFDSSLSIEVKYDKTRHEIIFSDGKPCRLRVGDWVVITQYGKIRLDGFGTGSLLISNLIQGVHQSIIELWIYRYIRLSDCRELG